jgi:hypothetical protein
MPENNVVNVQDSKQSFKIAFISCLIVSIVISIASITNQSLWIDEAATAWLASHPTFSALIDTQINTQINATYGETQKLFHVWYIWAWARFFGISEYSLRFSNLPFLFIFLLSVQWGAKTLFKSRWLWVLAALNPFVWFYMNEARPYMGVIAFSSLAIVSLLIYLLEPMYKSRLLPWLCLFGLFMASGMIMLGVFILPCFFVALVWAYRWDLEKWKQFLKDWLWPVLSFLALFIALGGWFVWVTLYQGVKGQIETPSVVNGLFGLYEFLGFLGLGPPRNLLRSAPSVRAFIQSGYTLTFITGVICWIIVSVISLANIWKYGLSKRISLLIFMFLVGIVSFHFVAYFLHFRYWGRHMAQYFPLFILIVIAIIARISERYREVHSGHVVTCLLIALWLISSVRLAFLSQYAKDDYRSAVSNAISAVSKGGTLLWAADTIGAGYYGLSCINDPLPKVFWPTPFQAVRAVNPDKDQVDNMLNNNTLPMVIAVGKPDLFDSKHTLENELQKRNARLISAPNTFRVYYVPR